MAKLIGYARVSTRQQSTDRQQADLLAAGVRRDDLYIDHGASGARASRPQFDRALEALIEGDTLVITTMDRLGRSAQNMLALADELRSRRAGRRVLNLGGGDVDTATPMGSMLFTIMPPLLRWNTRSGANASRIPSTSEEKRARTLVAGPAGSPIARSEVPSSWSTAANPQRRLPAT